MSRRRIAPGRALRGATRPGHRWPVASLRSDLADYLRGSISTLAILGVLLWGSPASAYSGIAMQAFALWPPEYCAQGSGEWGYVSGSGSGTHVSIAARTYSMRGAGNCANASTAGANVFAAWAKVEHLNGGTWSICSYAPWAGNASGTWTVQSSDNDLALGCGTGLYRLRSENRITYGGNNYYSPPFVSSSITV
ncbi:MAG: hypothetical protein R2701_11955 [Acidimicrobiales bacterium]